jgi:hypothetical protein
MDLLLVTSTVEEARNVGFQLLTDAAFISEVRKNGNQSVNLKIRMNFAVDL